MKTFLSNEIYANKGNIYIYISIYIYIYNYKDIYVYIHVYKCFNYSAPYRMEAKKFNTIQVNWSGTCYKQLVVSKIKQKMVGYISLTWDYSTALKFLVHLLTVSRVL